MDTLPLISVVVPVYKVEKYLDRCVGSILAQSYGNLEVFLVEDGSPDRSAKLCDVWAARDSRVTAIHKENGGAGAARNAALDAAKGELIAFVDSDDYIAPDMFQYLYSLLQQGADIAECGYVPTEDDHAAFDTEGGDVRFFTAEEAMGCHIDDSIFRQLIWNKLYRRAVVDGVRFPVGTKIDDEFFTYRVLGNAATLAHSDRVLYAYRQQPDSIMHQKNPVKSRESIRAKTQRLEYIRAQMPALADRAAAELYLNGMYCLQDYLRETPGAQREEAIQSVLELMHQLRPLNLAAVSSAKRKGLLLLGQRFPRATCRLMNLLTDIHVLT